MTLALIEAAYALLPYNSPERQAFDTMVSAAVKTAAKVSGVPTPDLEDKADSLSEYGEPVLYHP